MTAFIFYLLKVLVCSGLLFAYYLVALKNKAFHQWNRFYLLSAVALSVTLPLVQIVVMTATGQDAAVQLLRIVQSADDYMEAVTVSARPHVSTEKWFTAGYVLASLLLFTGAVLSLIKIHRLAKKWGVQRVEGIRFVNTAEPGTPFSFLRSVFWNREIPLDSAVGRQIFQHELVHVKEKHTLDKLFLQAVLVVFWFNPFFWLIKKELRFIHEFIADKQSVGEAGTAAFATMVLQTAYPSHYPSLVNPFFQTSIKRRLLMLTKIQNPRLNYLSRIVALPLIAVVAFAFSVRTKEKPVKPSGLFPAVLANTDTIPKAKKEIVSVDVNRAKSLLTIYYADGSCETMTEQEANGRGLINNGGYGNIQKASPQKPGAKPEIRLRDSSVKPLIVIDGEIVRYDLINAIDPNKIESINVLDGPSAVAKYGNKGNHGVIEIKIKTKTISGGTIKLQTDELTGTIDSLEIYSTRPLSLRANITVDSSGSNNGSKIELNEVTVVGYPFRKEPVFERTETPASVDKNEWQTFLARSTQPIIESMVYKGAKPGKYTVNVRFLVEQDGSLSDVKLLNTLGYGADAKIVEMMKASPKWVPAEQNGKIVRSYHTQPIAFVIAGR